MNANDILRLAVECQLITTGNRDGVYAGALIHFANCVRAKALAEQPAAWVELSDEDKAEIGRQAGITEDDDGYIVGQLFRLTEAKLKEKNGGRGMSGDHNLRGANLYGADLRGANLYRADLSGANLYRADLSGANLYGANLYRTDLGRADLGRADLSGANLSGADLGRANLSGADLSGANLSGANLYGADLGRADLSGADLGGEFGKLVGDHPLLQIGPVGSRSDWVQAYMCENGVVIRTGCFFGFLPDFESAVAKTHGNNPHGREYAAAVTLIKAHAEIWGNAIRQTTKDGIARAGGKT